MALFVSGLFFVTALTIAIATIVATLFQSRDAILKTLADGLYQPDTVGLLPPATIRPIKFVNLERAGANGAVSGSLRRLVQLHAAA